MKTNHWEEDILSSPKGVSPDVECPSPDRVHIVQAFQVCQSGLDQFKKISNPPSANTDQKVQQLKHHNENQKLKIQIASQYQRESDSEYCQSEEFSKGSQYFQQPIKIDKKMAKHLKTKKIKKLKQVTIFEQQNDRFVGRNLKSISKQVYSIVKKLKKNETISNDDLARLILSKDEVDGKKDKNVRRRLYDSINVLDAIGLVGKVGGKNGNKKGSYSSIHLNSRISESSMNVQQSNEDSILHKIIRITKIIDKKKARLQSLQLNKNALSQLFKRNQKLANKQALTISIPELNSSPSSTCRIEEQNPQSTKVSTKKKFFFPLYLFRIQENEEIFFKYEDNIFSYHGNINEGYSHFDMIKQIDFSRQSCGKKSKSMKKEERKIGRRKAKYS